MTQTPGTPRPEQDPHDDPSAPARSSRTPGVIALVVATLTAAAVAVAATLLVLQQGDDATGAVSADASPPPTDTTSDATPSQTIDPSPAATSASSTPSPTAQASGATDGGTSTRRGIDAANPLAPWQVSAADADGRATWSLPVFRSANVPNPTGAPPSSDSGGDSAENDLRVLVDPQRVRSNGSPQRLLTQALGASVSPPATREADNGLPYGAPYENLFADGVTLSSATLSEDGTLVRVDLASGPSGELLDTDDWTEVARKQSTAYHQLAWTAAAVLADSGVSVLVSLDGEERPLPATNIGDATPARPELLAPVQLVAPFEGSEQSGEIRVVALVRGSATNPSAYLAGSGEDTFETAMLEPGAEEPLGTGLRLVDTTLTLAEARTPADVEVGIQAGQVTDARVVRVAAD